MIECSFCNVWYHVDCLKFNKSSLNKIKKLQCPVCSLIKAADLHASLEIHAQERTPFSDYQKLVLEVQQMSSFITLSSNHRDILMFQARYLELEKVATAKIELLEGYLNSEVDETTAVELLRSRTEATVEELKGCLKLLLGLPFVCELLESITRAIRKRSLVCQMLVAEEKKRLSIVDVYSFEAFRDGIQFPSAFLSKKAQQFKQVYETLSRFEQAEARREGFPQYRESLMQAVKGLQKDAYLLEGKVREAEGWPQQSLNILAKVNSPEPLLLKTFREDLAVVEKLPFSSEIEEELKQKIKLVEGYKREVQRLKDRTDPPASQTEYFEKYHQLMNNRLSQSEPEMVFLKALIKQ